MNREAALLGTPVFGFFEGRLAALDRRLIDEGRLRPADGDAGALHAELERLLEDGGEREVHPVTSHVRDRFVEAILTPF
jgi:predicted glycosyltransferase